MIRAIIIDDEPRARRLLEALLKEYCAEIEVVATAGDVPEGVLAINQHRPDVLFLDVEMPGYTGFQLLDFFREVDFEIIFTTAHSGYALQAFRVSAVDYLLKPVQISELVAAVEKLKQKKAGTPQRLATLQENFKGEQIRRLALPVAEGLVFVETDNIAYLEADGAYTHFHFSDGGTLLVSRKIKEFEESLTEQSTFFRPHRSYIINLKKVVQYAKQEGGYIVLQGNVQIPLARERKNDFLEIVERISL